MGIFFNKPLLERQLTDELRRDKKIDKLKRKVLILGPTHSGKSTIFNQLKYIHGNGFTANEYIEAKHSICSYVIESMQHIIECVEEYEKFKQFPFTKFSINTEGKLSAEFIKSLSVQQANLSELIIYHIEILWKQKAIKKVVANASKYYLDDSCQYFFKSENMTRFKSQNYVPSDQDIIQLRIKCNGFNETNIQMGFENFTVYDLNYKPDTCNMRKIMGCFVGVTAIIFVASLSCFDEQIFEDEKSYQQKLKWKQSLTYVEGFVGDDILGVILSFVGYPRNAMHDALDVFEELCDNDWFTTIPIILMLNKSDLFSQKMEKIQASNDTIDGFNVCFPEFKETCDYIKCSNYISQQFRKRNKRKVYRKIFQHLVNGTETSIMRKILRDVQEIVISTALDHAGIF